jgi:hypothetical protein
LQGAHVGDAWKPRRVKIGHASANVLDPRAFDTPGEAMDTALRVDYDKIPAVAACQDVTRFPQRTGKGLAAVGAAPHIRDRRFDRLHAEADTLGLKHLRMGGGALGPFFAFAFDMRALYPRVAEFAFKLARHLLMFPIIVAVADDAHAVKVDPAPHNVAVLAKAISGISFAMDHDHMRLTQKTERGFQAVDRVRALFISQPLVRACVNRGMIERTLGACAEGKGFHFAKCAIQIFCRDATQFVKFVVLIGLGAGQVFGDPRGARARCAFNDHGPAL